MKLVCDCGEELLFIKDEDSDYIDGEGWYCNKRGEIDIYGEHDQVCFHCRKCGAEYWIFT